MREVIARIKRSWPARAWQRYSEMRGPVLAQGMTLQAFLSIFAALFVGFAVFMAILGGDEQLRQAVITAIGDAVPGLIGEGGAIDVDALTGSSIVGWAGVLAAASIIVTAIAWVGVSREGFRAMFGLDGSPSNVVLLKLGDLAVAIGIGLLVLVSAAIQVATQPLISSLGLVGATQVVSALVQVALDTAIVALLFRFGGRLKLPVKHMLLAALTCALGCLALKLLATELFGAVQHNPLLAGVAAPVIMLLWFGFIMQLLLVTLAFVAVTPAGRAYSARVTESNADGTDRSAQQGRMHGRTSVGS